mmetsp:Transcript_26900/g.61981  ORF Transcript_26900/g.61981 Transcript_26900/m.61981 type:complete len:261 (-) Transcript_26900:322-1104(-)
MCRVVQYQGCRRAGPKANVHVHRAHAGREIAAEPHVGDWPAARQDQHAQLGQACGRRVQCQRRGAASCRLGPPVWRIPGRPRQRHPHGPRRDDRARHGAGPGRGGAGGGPRGGRGVGCRLARRMRSRGVDDGGGVGVGRAGPCCAAAVGRQLRRRRGDEHRLQLQGQRDAVLLVVRRRGLADAAAAGPGQLAVRAGALLLPFQHRGQLCVFAPPLGCSCRRRHASRAHGGAVSGRNPCNPCRSGGLPACAKARARFCCLL